MGEEFEEAFGVRVANNTQKGECVHDMRKDCDGLHVCINCGFEKEIFDYAPEWRIYDDPSKNPIRCHAIISDQSSLEKTLEKLDIKLPESIKTKVDEKYKVIVDATKSRGKARLSIIAACLFIVYKEMGETKTNEEIRMLFPSLPKKKLADGLTIYYRHFPQQKNNITSAHELVKNFATYNDLKPLVLEIVDFTKNMEKKTATLNRSSPQAIAAACILYYATNIKGIYIHKPTFASDVGLSEITINRLMTEINRIFPNFVVKDGRTYLK